MPEELKDYTSPRVFDGVRPLPASAVERIRARRRILDKYHARRDREVHLAARLTIWGIILRGAVALPLIFLALVALFAK